MEFVLVLVVIAFCCVCRAYVRLQAPTEYHQDGRKRDRGTSTAMVRTRVSDSVERIAFVEVDDDGHVLTKEIEA